MSLLSRVISTERTLKVSLHFNWAPSQQGTLVGCPTLPLDAVQIDHFARISVHVPCWFLMKLYGVHQVWWSIKDLIESII